MDSIAILGGTFDPVHWGHLLIAQTALNQLSLDRVIWIPAHCPPHKRGVAYEHRRAMVESAIADNPAFVFDAARTDNLKPDYAISTLLKLQDAYPQRQWYWILGLDAFQTLPRWYRRERLIPACNWLVAPRSVPMAKSATIFTKSGSDFQDIDTQENWLCQKVAEQLASQNILIRWQLLQMPLLEISSSLIRQHCRQHCSIRYLVPEAVQTYITSNNLYLQ